MQTLLTISSMYYGASDKAGLKRVFSYAMVTCVKITFVVAVIVFFGAPFLARIYTSDSEVVKLSIFSIRCMALGLCLHDIGMGISRKDYEEFLEKLDLTSYRKAHPEAAEKRSDLRIFQDVVKVEYMDGI